MEQELVSAMGNNNHLTMNNNRKPHDDVQDKVLQRAELAHYIWNLRFNLNKVTKRILLEAEVFQENGKTKPQLKIEQPIRQFFYPECLEEENMPLIREFKCLDSPPPVPPSSSQEDDEESRLGSPY